MIKNIRAKGYYGAMGGRLDSPTWGWGYRPVKNGQDEYWAKEKVEKICESVINGLVESPKSANFQISHLMISIGYGIEICKF